MAVSERDLRQTSLEYILLGETIDKDGNEVDLLVVSELRKRDNFRMQRREGQKGRSLRPSPRELKALYRGGNIHFNEDGEERFRSVMEQLNVDLDHDDAPVRSAKKVQKAKKVSKSVTASGELDSLTVSELRDMVRDMGGSIYANSRQKNKTALIETILELQGSDDAPVATPADKVEETVEAVTDAVSVPVIPEAPEIEVPSIDVPTAPEPDEDIVADTIDEIAETTDETITEVADDLGFVSDITTGIKSLDIDADKVDAPEFDDIAVEAPAVVAAPADIDLPVDEDELDDDLSAFDSFLGDDLPGMPSFTTAPAEEPVAESIVDTVAENVEEAKDDIEDGIKSVFETAGDNLDGFDVDSMFSDLDESFDVVHDEDDAMEAEGAGETIAVEPEPVVDDVVDFEPIEVEPELVVDDVVDFEPIEVAPIVDEVAESEPVIEEVAESEKPRTILFNIPSDDDEKIDLVDEVEVAQPSEPDIVAVADDISLPDEVEPTQAPDFFATGDSDSDLDDLFSNDESGDVSDFFAPSWKADASVSATDEDTPADDIDEIDEFVDIDEVEEIEDIDTTNYVDAFDIDEPVEVEEVGTDEYAETFDIDEPEEIEEPIVPQRRRAIPQRRQGVAVGDLSDDVTPIASKISLSDSNLDISPVVAPATSAADFIDEKADQAKQEISETFDDVISVVDDDDESVADDDKIAVKDEESDLIDLFEDLDNEGIKTSDDLMGAFYPEGQEDVADEPQEPVNGYSGFKFAWSDKATGTDEQPAQGEGTYDDASFEDGFDVPADSSAYDDLDDDFFATDGTGTDDGYGDKATSYDQYRVTEGIADGQQGYGYDADDSGIYEIPIDEPADMVDDDIDDGDGMPGRMTPDGYPVSDGDQRGLNEEDRGLVRKTFKRMLIAIAVVAIIGIAGIAWLMANGISIFPSIQLP